MPWIGNHMRFTPINTGILVVKRAALCNRFILRELMAGTVKTPVVPKNGFQTVRFILFRYNYTDHACSP